MKNKIFPLISLGNEASPVLPMGGITRAGEIALANEARFTTATFSEPLTQYAVGWKDTENLQELVNYLAPRVPVGRRFEFKKAKNSEAFLSELDDTREIGSAFKRVEYRGETVNEKTTNRGLTIRLDRDEMSGLMDEERAVALLMQRLLRNKLRRAVTAILAIATDNPVTWIGGTPPDEDMRAAIAAGQLASGVFPNRGIIGLTAWNTRASALSQGESAGDFAGIGKTPREVGQMLGLEDFRTMSSLYQSSGTAKTRILQGLAVFFYAQDFVGKDDPTNLKQFVSSVDGGGDLRAHREEVGPKFVDITVEHYDNILGTSTVGAQKLTVTAGS
jgi:hypothetical protein